MSRYLNDDTKLLVVAEQDTNPSSGLEYITLVYTTKHEITLDWFEIGCTIKFKWHIMLFAAPPNSKKSRADKSDTFSRVDPKRKFIIWEYVSYTALSKNRCQSKSNRGWYMSAEDLHDSVLSPQSYDQFNWGAIRWKTAIADDAWC